MTIGRFRTNIAAACGINAAVVAEILWDQLNEQIADGMSEEHYGYDWCRCSYVMVRVISAFLSEHRVKDAVNMLIKKNIIRKDHFNGSKFDRTNWYAFTEYGVRMMMEGEE